MKPDDFSRPAMLDEQLEALTNELDRRQQSQRSLADAPDLRLTQDIRHAYQLETDEDQRSLERVLTRLVGDDEVDRPKVIFLPQTDKTQKRMSAMQTNTMNSAPQPKMQSDWKRRMGLIAAVLCVALLMGGFLTVLNATRANHTTDAGSHTSVTPTPQPSTPEAIQKALLTDSLAGSSEGVGPNLEGLTATTHFTAGQQFWIVFLANANRGGTVTAKWYENNNLYKTSSAYMPALSSNPSGVSPTPTPSWVTPTTTPSGITPEPSPTPNPSPASSVESNFSMTYNQAAAGKVELYWNGHLEITLLFVVSSK